MSRGWFELSERINEHHPFVQGWWDNGVILENKVIDFPEAMKSVILSFSHNCLKKFFFVYNLINYINLVWNSFCHDKYKLNNIVTHSKGNVPMMNLKIKILRFES